jgi:hypothetical protein
MNIDDITEKIIANSNRIVKVTSEDLDLLLQNRKAYYNHEIMLYTLPYNCDGGWCKDYKILEVVSL